MYRTLLVCMLGFTLNGCANQIRVPSSCETVNQCAELVKLKIQSNLEFDESFKDQTVKVNFHLDQRANVVSYTMLEPSNVIKLNEAVKSAVFASSPFSEVLSADSDVFSEIKEVNLIVIPQLD
ncbi:cell envelope integrity protein TolA [Shewanella sp. HN-41]|uniref:cell envelope integrity protein TolA n=1 Tax=Shewanella sp. HN-41 TaxID=327275 RepID=UPI00021269BC|nr:cell envelope integrity protein TolA [Shewanella sp. HN-41]EGM68971.1 hypothetical protein SOHN41_03036 [Shewanella sp. HN-41]